MYKFVPPTPIVIPLSGEKGFELRKEAAKYIEDSFNTTGAERGNKEQQGFGALAEVVIRKELGIIKEQRDLAFDILLPSGVKLDVKCRGGELAFKEEYLHADGLTRAAKHNFFARQIFDENLNTDIYLMTHLETPSKNRLLPGTNRQKKWKLYICGWVSKKRVFREGVYLPRGSLTEQGNSWFTYRGQEIEFYNKNLNGIKQIKDLLTVDGADVKKDESKKGDLNLTSVDALRIAYDLAGRGFLNQKQIEFVKHKLGIIDTASSILHPNQYYHLMEWLKELGQIDNNEFKRFEKKIKKSFYEGI